MNTAELLKKIEEVNKDKVAELRKIEKAIEDKIFGMRHFEIVDKSPENIPYGDYVSHSWAGTDGMIVSGNLLVLREGELMWIEFENNKETFSENGTITGEYETSWDDNLESDDVVLGAEYEVRITDYNGYDSREEYKYLYKKPYFMCDKRMEEIKKDLEKFQEFLKNIDI